MTVFDIDREEIKALSLMNLYGYRQLLIYLFSIDWVIVWYLQKEDSRPHWSFCGMVQELNFPTRGLFNKQRSLDCALFCCKTRRKWLEHERSVGRNTRRVEYCSRFLSALQQNRALSRLLYLLNILQFVISCLFGLYKETIYLVESCSNLLQFCRSPSYSQCVCVSKLTVRTFIPLKTLNKNTSL